MIGQQLNKQTECVYSDSLMFVVVVVVAVFQSQIDACRVTTVRYSQNKKIKITNNNVGNGRARAHTSVHARIDHIHKYTWIKHLTRNHRPDFNINLTSLSECLPMQICDFSIETTRFYTLYVLFVCCAVWWCRDDKWAIGVRTPNNWASILNNKQYN